MLGGVDLLNTPPNPLQYSGANTPWNKMASLYNQHKAVGNLGIGADGVKFSCAVNGAPGSGRGMTITPVTGLGAYMPANLDKIVTTYKAQIRADRRSAARERMGGLDPTFTTPLRPLQ